MNLVKDESNIDFNNQSIARKWMEVLLEAIRNDLARPPVHARNLFHLSSIMYDAFVINKKHTKNGYAKMLKRVYLNWAKKQEGILYITGHVMEGISKKFKGDITIINKTKNWQGTSKTFEYYRRKLS